MFQGDRSDAHEWRDNPETGVAKAAEVSDSEAALMQAERVAARTRLVNPSMAGGPPPCSR